MVNFIITLALRIQNVLRKAVIATVLNDYLLIKTFIRNLSDPGTHLLTFVVLGIKMPEK